MTVRKNVMVGWGAHLIVVLMGFYLMPYILHTIGEAQYGAWVFINGIAGYSTLIYGGFGATICRFVADLYARKEWDKLNAVVSTIQVVYATLASLVVLFTVVFAWLAPSLNQWGELPVHEVQISILMVGITMTIGMVASVYGGVLVGTQRLDLKRGIEVSMGILRFGLTIYCLHQRFGLITLSSIFMVTTILEHSLSAYLAYRQVPELSVVPWKFRRDTFKECAGFSALSVVAQLAEYLIYFTDTIIIGLVLGPLAIVPYQIGLRIVQMIQIPIGQIGEAVLPKAGELNALGKTRELSNLVLQAMGVALLLAGSFVIGSTYFGSLLIGTWIGLEYVSSQKILVLLIAAQLVALPMVVVRKALLGMGQVRTQVWIDLFEAALNLVFSLIFIQFWGIIGVAWGTFIPLYLVEIFILLPHAMKILNFNYRDVWRVVILPVVPALAVLLIFSECVFSHIPERGWGALFLVTTIGGGLTLGSRYLIYRFEQRCHSSESSGQQTLEAAARPL